MTISALSLQVLAYILGKFMHIVLPTTCFRTFGHSWSLNPGPFNIKEHVVIGFMINVGFNGIYATDIIATQKVFFNQETPYLYQLLVCTSTTIIGFGLVGFIRPFIVWPASMIWPASLVNATIYNTLHGTFGNTQKGMSRLKFFVIVLICAAVWYLLPGYLFTSLSVFNWVCWIAPTNVIINQIFGYNTGLGVGFLTFDWAQISWLSSPLVTPVSMICF